MTTTFDAPVNGLEELTQYLTYRAHVRVVTSFGDKWSIIIEFFDQNSLRRQLEKWLIESGRILSRQPPELTEFSLSNSQINVLPGNAADMFMDIFLNLKSLVQVTLPEGFLSPAQNAALQAHIDQNELLQALTKQRIEDRENQTVLHWNVLTGLFLAVPISHLASRGFWLIGILISIIGTLCSNFIKFLLIFESSKCYNTEQSILESSPSEKVALKAGVEIETWPGYFKSFGIWQAYRHPLAFTAARQHVEKEHETLTQTIRALP